MTETAVAPERRQAQSEANRWRDRRVLSWMLRGVIAGAPLAAGLGATGVFLSVLERPATAALQALFWAGAVVASSIAAFLTHSRVRRLRSLATLLRLPLIFPDTPPNRLRVAARQNRPAWLQSQLNAAVLDDDGPVNAERLLFLLALLGQHDRAIRGHADRVLAYATLIATAMELPPEDVDKLRWSALTHDLGKLSIPAELLAKPHLSDAERALVQNHPAAAEPYVRGLEAWLGDWAAAAIDHHEHFDGDGYPHGRAGDEISLAGRIVAVADAYDVMTSPRSYRTPQSPTAAREEIARHAGSQFDPAIVRAFLAVPVDRLRRQLGPAGWLSEWSWSADIRPGAISTAFNLLTAAAIAVTLSATTLVTGVGPATETVEVAAPPTTTLAPSTTTTPVTTTLSPSTTTAPTTTTEPPLATTTVPVPTTTVAPSTTTAPPTTLEVAVIDPTPSGTGFTVIEPATLPFHLGEGQLTADDNAFVWAEQRRTLTEPMTLPSFIDGQPVESRLSATITVATNSTVCSFFVHVDPELPAGEHLVELDLGVTPLSVAVTGNDLDRTSEFAVDDVDYRPDGLGRADVITVAGTRISIRFDHSISGRDQARIFVPC